MELIQVCDSGDGPARLKERLGSQVCSLIICRARRCTLSSWASEVVDEPIQTRGAYSRSGRTNPFYMVSRCLGLSIGAARRRRCRRLLARRATDRMWLLNVRWLSKVTPRSLISLSSSTGVPPKQIGGTVHAGR